MWDGPYHTTDDKDANFGLIVTVIRYMKDQLRDKWKKGDEESVELATHRIY